MIEFEKHNWKDKYPIEWCDLCNCFYIKCISCGNISCSGGGCDLCVSDFTEFTKNTKYRIEHYLTEEEIKVYRKIIQLKKFMYKTLCNNENQIDWKKLHNEEKLSENDEAMFLL